MPNQNHQAQYDENGNIILPFESQSQEAEIQQNQVSEDVDETAYKKRDLLAGCWAVIEEENEECEGSKECEEEVKEEEDVIAIEESHIPARKLVNIPSPSKIWNEARSKIFETTNSVIVESKNQYAFSFRSLRNHLKKGVRGFFGAIRSTWEMLAQPVYVIKPKKDPKKYSRGTLFFLDTVRFGGTFASIFVLLFVGLNYNSFWQIASEKINPLRTAQQINQQTSALDTALREKLKGTPNLATAGRIDGELMTYLPEVGPPENRIIIPKLGMNVPLVTPSYKSLLDEDWEQVEEDIQDALQMGVVHYPGTARPGQAGNFFVTGHSSYYPWAPGRYKTVFARLHGLEVGDEYYVYYGGDKHRYVITEKKEVKPTNVDVLDQPLDRRVGTLMTCSPVGTTLRRLILVAQEIDPLTGEMMAVGEQTERVEKTNMPKMLPI